MVDLLTEELDVSVVGGGHDDAQASRTWTEGPSPTGATGSGTMPGVCRGKRRLDLNRDPAPDLIIEVDVDSHLTRSAQDLRRYGGAGSLAIPEADPSSSSISRRTGLIRPRTTSRNFPSLPVASVAQFFKEGRTADSTAWTRSFRAFVRERWFPVTAEDDPRSDSPPGQPLRRGALRTIGRRTLHSDRRTVHEAQFRRPRLRKPFVSTGVSVFRPRNGLIRGNGIGHQGGRCDQTSPVPDRTPRKEYEPAPPHDRKASSSVGSGVRSGRNGVRSRRGGRPSTRSATSSAVAGASCKPARLWPVATIRFARPGAVPM